MSSSLAKTQQRHKFNGDAHQELGLMDVLQENNLDYWAKNLCGQKLQRGGGGSYQEHHPIKL